MNSTTCRDTTFIDLTGDSSEPEDMTHDDEAYAKALQAQFDNEEIQIESKAPARDRSLNDLSASVPYNTRDDQDVARKLPAEWDVEDGRKVTEPSRKRVDLSKPSQIPPAIPKSTHFSGSQIMQVQEVQSSVRGLAQALNKVKCTCKRSPLKSESDVLKLAETVLALHPDSCIHCSCGQMIHCEDDELVKIWALLSLFDVKSKQNRPEKKQANPDSTRPAAFSKKNGNGTGYGSEGRGYYHPLGGARVPPKPVQPKRSTLDEDDSMTSEIMSFLSKLLPDYDRDSKFDRDAPAKQLQSLFLCSSILERAAELLRNNDLEDVTNRATLYVSLIQFVRRLSGHSSTSCLTFGQRLVRSPGVDVFKVSVGKANLIESRDLDTTQPLAHCMADLAIQADMMLRSVPGQDSADLQEVQLFHAIKELSGFIAANSSAEKASNGNKNSWHKQLAILDVPDDLIMRSHKLAAKPDQGTLNSVPGRMKRIMKDLAGLKASLPDGIFVRHCTSRPDIMKVLIVGPQGTPYENGLFEFDLLCPPSYPVSPPQMHFRTTGGGTVGFNPNLYTDGKVCLSLLGTWTGEPWNPAQSTLLQVLVSIQAMIFCEKPWENEPGRENYPNAECSNKMYNQSLYPHTIRTAMLDWLEGRQHPAAHRRHLRMPTEFRDPLSPPSSTDDSVWTEIAKKHFESCEGDIIQTVGKWVSETVAHRDQSSNLRSVQLPNHLPPNSNIDYGKFDGNAWSGFQPSGHFPSHHGPEGTLAGPSAGSHLGGIPVNSASASTKVPKFQPANSGQANAYHGPAHTSAATFGSNPTYLSPLAMQNQLPYAYGGGMPAPGNPQAPKPPSLFGVPTPFNGQGHSLVEPSTAFSPYHPMQSALPVNFSKLPPPPPISGRNGHLRKEMLVQSAEKKQAQATTLEGENLVQKLQGALDRLRKRVGPVPYY
ncbi:Hypothetical predicted protein [Lecanosticta acicola]|uniref:UBC core domain-containing protein n=1 Tax=Lecanosticta acicola TaxID=111012 RepID=A0AAI8Z2T2_9PEZI|nr:Hypothetical predicted protein [Lecanosticta acicola]